MKLSVLMTGLLSFASVALGDYAPNPDWENPQNLSLNREASRAFFVPFANRDEAMKGKRSDSSLVESLNGEWKFNWVPSPERRPVDFFKPDYDVTGWKNIPVPSTWQMEGYGTPLYCNQPYAFPRKWPFVMAAPQNDKEKEYTSVLTEPNAVGSYRRNFTVPEAWDGKSVFVQFDGVDSFFYLWINGEKVGFSKDSRTAAIFDITKYLKKGENVMAVEVYRFSDGSYLECQDMWRLSGIFRDVFLYATPTVQVRDFFVKTDRIGDSKDWNFKVEVDLRNLKAENGSDAPANCSLKVELLDAQGNLVADLPRLTSLDMVGRDFRSDYEGKLVDPKLWSGEHPYLYRLVMTLTNKDGVVQEVVSKKVGVRDVKLIDGRFLVNGQPIKLKGVNRHETHNKKGHTVSEEDFMKEVLLMKRGNINHIRNSHYPQPSYFYDLCDEYGIYVCDEANIESHGYYYGAESLSHPKEWLAAHVERNKNMVEQSKNHPSIVIWSYGNEAGPGQNFAAVRDWIKQRDTSRLTQYERNNDLADIRSNQYPSVGWAESEAAKKLAKPWYVSEYAHILCNSFGNFQDYWDAFEKSDSIIGGGIWEWIHQSYDKEVTLPDGKKITIQAYGGDHNEKPNDGIFSIKGVIYSDRTPTPIWYEVKKVHQNVSFAKEAPNKYVIKNKHCFTNLNEFQTSWEVQEEGDKVVQSGKLDFAIAPSTSQSVELPINFKALNPAKSYYIRFAVALKEDNSWEKAGYVIAEEKVLLQDVTKAALLEMSGKPLNVQGTTVSGENFSVTINPETGSIDSYVVQGKELLVPQVGGPLLNAYRAPLANDQWAMQEWFNNGLRSLTHKAEPVKVEKLKDGGVRVVTEVLSKGTRKEQMENYVSGKGNIKDLGPLATDSFQFRTKLIYTVLPNGVVGVNAVIVPENGKPVLPKLGYIMQLPQNMNQVTWFGRGEVENYPDRKSAAPMGIYTKSVDQMVENYPKPMEMGNRMDTEWVALRDNEGNGLMVVADEKMNFSALPFTPQAITDAAHPHELKRSGSVVLSVDALTLGLGGASCGPLPMDRDITRAEPITFGYTLRPIFAGQNPADVGCTVMPVTAPVVLHRDDSGMLSASTTTPNAEIRLILPNGKSVIYTKPVMFRKGGLIKAAARGEGRMSSEITESTFDVWFPNNMLSIASVSSEMPSEGEAASAMLDGKRETHWHSQWKPTESKYPHEVVLKVGTLVEIAALNILPRQGQPNGRVGELDIYLSKDGKNWPSKPATVAKMQPTAEQQKIVFDRPEAAQFIKLVCTKPANAGENFAAIAEVSIVPRKILGKLPAQALHAIAFTNSEMPAEGEAKNVLDGNPDTYWHTQYGLTLADYPHEVQIDLGSLSKATGIKYVPCKQKAAARIGDYAVYASTDGKSWGKAIATGKFAPGDAEQMISFAKPVECRYIRFEALTALEGGNSAAAASLEVQVAE